MLCHKAQQTDTDIAMVVYNAAVGRIVAGYKGPDSPKAKRRCPETAPFLNMAEEQGFEPWVGYKPTPVFKTGALNHSATPPNETHNSPETASCKPLLSKKQSIA